MSFIQVPAFAKVNLRLDVLGRRSDGYHELRTVFQALTLHDSLRLERTKGPAIELNVTRDAALAARAQTFRRAARRASQAHPRGPGARWRFQRRCGGSGGAFALDAAPGRA